MSEHPLFETVDPVALDRVANGLGERFMAAARPFLEQLAEDDTIAPAALLSGMVKAHLAGAVAGMFQAARTPEARAEIVADAADWLGKRLEELEAQRDAIHCLECAILSSLGDQPSPANDL